MHIIVVNQEALDDDLAIQFLGMAGFAAQEGTYKVLNESGTLAVVLRVHQSGVLEVVEGVSV